jgi:transposase
MSYIRGVDRSQQVLFPETLDEYLREDNPVRFLDAFVGQLDLGALGFARAVPAEVGRPGYDPGDLLRLYLYGYLYGIRSSRKLERETQRNVELMWLLRRLRPDFKTIADFRRDHPEALRQVYREFTLLCKRLDLFGGELIAIDGSKFRAVNSKQRNWTRAGLERVQAQIEERIARYLAQLEAEDTAEATVPAPTAAELAAQVTALRQRQEQVQTRLADLETRGVTQHSATDPDSRRMRDGEGTVMGYNVQLAVDARHHLIVAQEVTNVGNDRQQLSPMTAAAAAVLQPAQGLAVVADRGYYHGPQIVQCVEAGHQPLVAKPESSNNGPHGRFTKGDFRYDPAQDAYHCPGGATLTRTSTSVEEGRRFCRYTTPACGTCGLRTRCTTSRTGRRLERWEHEDVLDAMAVRLARQRDVMRQRSRLVEAPFGSIKRAMGQDYFLLRGLRKVRGEFSLTALAYNLKRAINLLGVPRLIAAVT